MFSPPRFLSNTSESPRRRPEELWGGVGGSSHLHHDHCFAVDILIAGMRNHVLKQSLKSCLVKHSPSRSNQQHDCWGSLPKPNSLSPAVADNSEEHTSIECTSSESANSPEPYNSVGDGAYQSFASASETRYRTTAIIWPPKEFLSTPAQRLLTFST